MATSSNSQRGPKKRRRIRELLGRVRHYATLGVSGIGLTGARAPAGPLYAQIGIADPCNHRCVMCWDHPPEQRESESTSDRFGGVKPGTMSLRHLRETVDELHATGTRHIDFVGRGEPLANPAAVDMVEYAKGKDMYVSIVSNGSLLTSQRAERLVAAGLDRLQISLNAGTPETYPLIHVTETPENYLKVKSNLRYLADCKTSAGTEAPYVRVGFVISSRNRHELEAMVAAVHEVGADEAIFSHATVHEGTPDLALSEGQYEELQAAVPGARKRAEELGVRTNLRSFEATPPTYLHAEMEGLPVVPCYAGWYFTVILGNGSVMPCCQCAKPIDQIRDGRSFRDIWNSDEYQRFREAARALPAKSEALASCECDKCMLRPRNISFHNFLHPLNRIEGGDDDQLFTLVDVFRGRKQDD